MKFKKCLTDHFHKIIDEIQKIDKSKRNDS